MEKKTVNREAIVAEYLTGEKPFCQLAAKQVLDFKKLLIIGKILRRLVIIDSFIYLGRY